jgi:hypothetical protein
MERPPPRGVLSIMRDQSACPWPGVVDSRRLLLRAVEWPAHLIRCPSLRRSPCLLLLNLCRHPHHTRMVTRHQVTLTTRELGAKPICIPSGINGAVRRYKPLHYRKQALFRNCIRLTCTISTCAIMGRCPKWASNWFVSFFLRYCSPVTYYRPYTSVRAPSPR